MRTAERREHVWGWRWGTAPERDARGNAQSLQKRIAEDVPTPVPKLELEGRSKNETQKCEEDEIKGIQKWSRKFRDILMLVPNTFPHPFSAKDVVVKLTGKVENALGSKGKNAAVHQKETEHNKKGGSARAIMSRGRCIDHPQKWKVLYLSID